MLQMEVWSMPVQIYPVNNQQHLTEFCLFPREIYRKGEYSVCYGNPGEIFNPQHNTVSVSYTHLMQKKQ